MSNLLSHNTLVVFHCFYHSNSHEELMLKYHNMNISTLMQPHAYHLEGEAYDNERSLSEPEMGWLVVF